MLVSVSVIPKQSKIKTEIIYTDPILIASNLFTTPTPEPVEWTTFEATAYCPCKICNGRWSNGTTTQTSAGTPAIEGVTIAADWSVLPNGTVVEIEGVGIRTVNDKGGAIKGKRIDVYFDNHSKALEFGRRKIKLRILEVVE